MDYFRQVIEFHESFFRVSRREEEKRFSRKFSSARGKSGEFQEESQLKNLKEECCVLDCDSNDCARLNFLRNASRVGKPADE